MHCIMTKKLQNHVGKSAEFFYNELLLSIQVRLAREITMINVGLPEPDFESELEVMLILQEELSFNKAALHNHVFESYPTLNIEQKYVFCQVVGSIINKEGKIIERFGNQSESR